MVQDQTRSQPTENSHHAHADRSVQYPHIIPIPEFPRAHPPQILRAEQRQFQQNSHNGLQETRCEYHPWTQDWSSSSHQANHAVPLFSERNHATVQSVAHRFGSSSAPLINQVNHSPAKRIDPAYSAHTPENRTMGRDSILSQQADILRHAHANRSAESHRTMPIPEFPGTVRRQISSAQQNIHPQDPHCTLQAIHRQCNPWRIERDDSAHNPSQTAPSFSSPNVAAGQSVPLRGGSSTASEVNRAEHVPLDWVYTRPGVDVQSNRHTVARRSGFPNFPRPPSNSSTRFYPPTNTASETRNCHSTVAARRALLPPVSPFLPVAVSYGSASELMHPNSAVGAQSHLHQNVRPGVNQQQITRANISTLPPNHRSSVSGSLSQKAVPSLTYRRLLSVERAPKGLQLKNSSHNTPSTQDRTGSRPPGPCRNSEDPQPSSNRVCALFAHNQSSRISSVASKRSSERKVNMGKITKRGKKRTGEAVRFYCAEKKCNTSFTRKYDLDKHVKVVHLNERPHKCNLCLSKFGHQGSLTKHIRAVHHKLKPFTCLYCGQRFSESGNLNKHTARKHTPPTTTQSGSSIGSGGNESNQNATAATSKLAQPTNSKAAPARKKRKVSVAAETREKKRNITPAHVPETKTSSTIETSISKKTA